MFRNTRVSDNIRPRGINNLKVKNMLDNVLLQMKRNIENNKAVLRD